MSNNAVQARRIRKRDTRNHLLSHLTTWQLPLSVRWRSGRLEARVGRRYFL
jgi:hypothetical protein